MPILYNIAWYCTRNCTGLVCSWHCELSVVLVPSNTVGFTAWAAAAAGPMYLDTEATWLGSSAAARPIGGSGLHHLNPGRPASALGRVRVTRVRRSTPGGTAGKSVVKRQCHCSEASPRTGATGPGLALALALAPGPCWHSARARLCQCRAWLVTASGFLVPYKIMNDLLICFIFIWYHIWFHIHMISYMKRLLLYHIWYHTMKLPTHFIWNISINHIWYHIHVISYMISCTSSSWYDIICPICRSNCAGPNILQVQLCCAGMHFEFFWLQVALDLLDPQDESKKARFVAYQQDILFWGKLALAHKVADRN